MISAELEQLYESDKSDRNKLDAGELSAEELEKNDLYRQAWLKQHINRIDFSEIWNCHYAALILQHSDQIEDIRQAHEFAKKAVQKGSNVTKWLFAATWDRMQVIQQRPQRYGTQFIYQEDAKQYFPVEKMLSDEELNEYGVESMQQKDFLSEFP